MPAADVAALDSPDAGRARVQGQGCKGTRRAQRTAVQIASALHDGADACQGDAAMDALLDKLAELPSGDPDDDIGGAVDALVAYRAELAKLGREVAAISG